MISINYNHNHFGIINDYFDFILVMVVVDGVFYFDYDDIMLFVFDVMPK